MSVVAQQRPPPLYIYIYAGGGRLRAATADSSRTCAYAQHSVLQNRQRPHPLGDGCPAAKGFFFSPPFLRPSFFHQIDNDLSGSWAALLPKIFALFPSPPPPPLFAPSFLFPVFAPLFLPVVQKVFLSLYIYI